jgi:hypothetical protein
MGLGLSKPYAITPRIIFKSIRVDNSSKDVMGIIHSSRLAISSSVRGLGSVDVSATGSDANINILLTPKGTGVVQFGTYTAGIIAQAGYITITDAGGTSRRLLVG